MFDDQDAEINVAIGMVLGVAIFVSLMVIGVALSVGGTFSPSSATVAAPAVPAAAEPVVAAPAAPAAAVGTVKIYFELGAAALPATAPGELAPIVAALQGKPESHAVISGFHDASGNAQSNAELAKQRALAVRDALVAAGVAAERVDLEKPQVTTGGSDPAEARRVEVSIR
ncbi:MAG TPA: OmpA family protein [Burkholderiaceae bacterium]|nr:OmpA family protein [Burkholderiaceae bacterium]